MEREAFVQALTQEGYSEFVLVTREAGALAEHSHPFEAKALILSGEIELLAAGEERLYRAGDVFHLAAGQPHAERYGAQGVQGVQSLVGRR
ncbi:cupin [Cupriavidus sp. USMAHM13]|uniref:cupin domain-containing protein n=1 Tax=Cupriavidus sp. USMAHM13 TaxID=1389192 RepID=UPI0008A69766|nr:cupin domain-containing protein [Cupriavidus sp. USMAHM13]AOZ03904.1 cupin [Cupriavidus sp. USMAHM13]